MGARQRYSIGVERPAAGGEDTALSNGVARGGRLRLHPDVTQWRIALARTPRNQKILSVAGQRPASTCGKETFAALATRISLSGKADIQHV